MRFMPILYESDEQSFTTNGLGRMTDLISCSVTQEMNADTYELAASYPVNSNLYEQIAVDRIIYAYPCKMISGMDYIADQVPQPFRIYLVSKDLESGQVDISATHACLHMMHNVVSCPGNLSGTADEIWTAIEAGKIVSGTEWPFTFLSKIETEADLDFEVPTTLYDLFFDEENGVLVKFACKLVLNKYQIILEPLDTDYNGTTIRQGNNMSSLKIVSDASEVVTGLVPYYSQEDDDGNVTTIYADPPVVKLDSAEVCFDHLLPYDCTSDIEKPDWAGDEWTPNRDDLTEWAEDYLSTNYDGYIPTTYASGLVTASDAITGDIYLGCIVAVLSKTLSARAKARVTGTTYNCLTDQYDSVSVGTARSNLAQTIVDLTNTKHKIEKVNLTARRGTSGDYTWTFNHAGNLVDVVIRHTIAGQSCRTSYSGKYRTAAISMSYPEDMSKFSGLTWESYDTKFLSSTEVQSTVSLSHSSSGVSAYVVSDSKCSVSGVIYIHYRMNTGDIEDTNYYTPVDMVYSAKESWYADCTGKNKKLTVYKDKTVSCYGKCSTMYANTYNLGTYYKCGFCVDGNNDQDITEYVEIDEETGKTNKWTAPAATKIYVESKLRTCIGTIPAGTECTCLAILGTSFLVCWPVEGQDYHRLGFTYISGGILDG